MADSEPLRVDRRLFRLSHAAMAGSFSAHGVVALLSASAGRMLPMGSSSRRLLEPVDPFERGELDGLA